MPDLTTGTETSLFSDIQDEGGAGGPQLGGRDPPAPLPHQQAIGDLIRPEGRHDCLPVVQRPQRGDRIRPAFILEIPGEGQGVVEDEAVQSRRPWLIHSLRSSPFSGWAFASMGPTGPLARHAW
jgi:hypothetical protein